MQLRKAQRKNAKIKMGLQGPSGSGKTMSALLLAHGLTGDWNKIAVIDTENQSSELYSHLGEYFTLKLTPPFNPERFIEALNVCENAGIEVVIIDSISHEWNGSGGVLDIHGNMAGNSFTNWAKITPRHNDFIDAILQSSCHIIATMRSKQDYVLTEKNGKMVPEKVGMAAVQRDGTDYEMTIVLELNHRHQATVSKDRTGLFSNIPEFMITRAIGEKIADWCNMGVAQGDVETMIERCRDVKTLREIFNNYPEFQSLLSQDFSKKKEMLTNVKPS